jgi:hypothetical protein
VKSQAIRVRQLLVTATCELPTPDHEQDHEWQSTLSVSWRP